MRAKSKLSLRDLESSCRHSLLVRVEQKFPTSDELPVYLMTV